MPFQDEDEFITSDPRPAPTRAEKLLRRIFIEDWSLKILSLAIAIVLWMLVTGQNQPVTAHVNVQLNFIRPPALEISNDPPRTVDVMLTGSRNKLDDLTSLDLVATVDISDQRSGERVLRLADKAQIILPQASRSTVSAQRDSNPPRRDRRAGKSAWIRNSKANQPTI
jgi:YbbR domain-containing protein